MQPELITRLVGLVQKTGERVILADPETGKAVVVMDLAEYERLCVAPPPAPAVASPVPLPVPAPHVQVHVPAPKTVEEISQKMAQPSDNPFKKRGRQLGVEGGVTPATSRDLTQEELLDKINRDIGAWKTAQERKRTDELKAVVQNTPRLETVNAMEDEERFYLEPIE